MAIKQTLQESKDKLDALLAYANSTTGNADASIGDAIKTLCDGYGGGGGYSVHDILGGIEGELVIEGNDFAGNAQKPAPASYAFAYSNITKLTALEWQGYYATNVTNLFDSCKSLREINAPNMIFFCPYMFMGCSALETVKFPRNKNGSTAYTFAGCSSLRVVDLEWDSLGHNMVFQNCTNLTSIILRHNAVVTLNAKTYWAFALKGTPFDTGSGGTIYVPSDLVESYKTAENWSTLYDAGLLTVRPLDEAPVI